MSTEPSTADEESRTKREILREMALDESLNATPVYREMYIRRYGVEPEEDA